MGLQLHGASPHVLDVPFRSPGRKADGLVILRRKNSVGRASRFLPSLPTPTVLRNPTEILQVHSQHIGVYKLEVQKREIPNRVLGRAAHAKQFARPIVETVEKVVRCDYRCYPRWKSLRV